MDEKQVAFITCINDEAEYAECRHYLERLYVPEGYCTDIISIQEAPSMAAGYNAGMKSSDAKYKVYLHQDVFIKNRNFISDLLEVFSRDEQIGMLGMIGNRISWEDISILATWDTGKVVDSSKRFFFRFPGKEDGFMEVQMADGLLLATQYDLLWREDIFDGWHFYDLAQCMEFKKSGYKVVVPWQEEAWCYHDNSYPKLDSYYGCYEAFLHEYGERADFPVENKEMDWSVYNRIMDAVQMQQNLRRVVESLFNAGEKIRLRYFFENPDLQGVEYLKEYEIIAHIDWQEEKNQSSLRLWKPEMTLAHLKWEMKKLIHALKRIEYGSNTNEQERDWILANYSEYAVTDACNHYITG